MNNRWAQFRGAVLGAALAASAVGCGGTFTAGAPRSTLRGEGLSIQWPARDLARAAAAGTAEESVQSAGVDAGTDSRRKPEVVRAVPVAMGVVRVIRDDPADPSGEWTDPRTGCSYRFTTYCERADLRQGWEARIGGARPEESSAPIVEGSRIALTMPSGSARAVLLYLPGMAGARPKALIDWARGQGLAFLEVRTCAMDTPSPPVSIRWTADIPAAAAAIAEDVDQRLAQTAYDAEGALEFFSRERPELGKLPVVIFGASAGALASPAVALRLGDRVRAVVLIGGGCDIFLISQKSNLAKKLLPVEWGARTSNIDLDRADAAYRGATRLDPLKLAPHLRGLPVLNVFATVDSFVPTPAARELQECLGNPDRLTYFGGHMLMFLSLRDDSSIVASWIASRVAAVNQSR